MLLSHLFLITVLCIGFIKLVQEALISSHLSYFLLPFDCRSRDLNVDFGAQWTEVGIETLFATNRMMWIKQVERLKEELVPAAGHLGEHT